MALTRFNSRYLAGFPMPDTIALTSDLREAAAHADILLSVTPSSAVAETIAALAPALTREHVFVSASKGLQDGTHRRMSEVVAAASPVRFAVLGGPSFAKEVAAALPTAATLASADVALAAQLQRDFSSDSLRVYTNDDVAGVELGGALKNVIALAAGVVAGLEFGSNAAAALITRGMAEMTRLAVACGAKPQTMSGLAGYGDLVLTCTGTLSRETGGVLTEYGAIATWLARTNPEAKLIPHDPDGRGAVGRGDGLCRGDRPHAGFHPLRTSREFLAGRSTEGSGADPRPRAIRPRHGNPGRQAGRHDMGRRRRLFGR